MKRCGTLSCILFCYLLLGGDMVFAMVVEQQVSQPVKQAISLLQTTQQEEEQWREEREALTARLDQLTASNNELTARKVNLESQVAATRSRIAEKTKELADIEEITGAIAPVVSGLHDQLGKVVARSLPFLPEERTKRIAALGKVIADPSVTVSEKYRKVMETLLIEAEYGFTFDVYQQTIAIQDKPTLVDIFRLGRVGLFYLTLDKRSCGFYNVAAKSWQPLAMHYLPQVKKAVAIGQKQLPVELLDLPVGRLSRKVQQ